MKITETKLVYPDFKLFKNIFTTINKAEGIIFYGENDKCKMLFTKDSNYFILTGEIESTDSKFLDWLKEGKTVFSTCSDLRIISNTLKRDVKSLDYSDSQFAFEFDGNIDTALTYTKVFANTNKYNSDKKKVSLMLDQLTHSKDFGVDSSILDDEILELYTSENMEITTERTSEKLIEIPVKRILSLIRGGSVIVSFSDRNELGQRLVSIKCENKDLGLTLNQIFMTV